MSLVVLAAGLGTRYGGEKQLQALGPGGATLLDYTISDAVRAGFGRVVLVIRSELEAAVRSTVGARWGGRVSLAYAHQRLDAVPPGHAPPPTRAKPWGTAHAVLATRSLIQGPFAVANADDFYGREAYTLMYDFLTTHPPDGADYAMVGYHLRHTLSAHGSVARGVCVTDGNGLLRSVREMTAIVPTATGAENRDDPAHPVALSGDETVSLSGLRAAMEKALKVHEAYPANKESLFVKQGRRPRWKTPESIPLLPGPKARADGSRAGRRNPCGPWA